MRDDSRLPAMDRREALRLLGGALGGIMLTSCTRSDDGGAPRGSLGQTAVLPNGYRFFPVFTAGIGVLPQISRLTPGILLNERGEITFYAAVGQGYGLFELQLDLAAATPVVRGQREVLTTGRTLPDGRRVDHIVNADVNAAGSIAAVLGTDWDEKPGNESQAISGVYLERDKRSFEPVASFNDRADEAGRRYGGAFGDIALRDDDQLLVVAHYMAEGTAAQGLFLVPAARQPAARLLYGAGEAIPTTSGAVTNALGLIDAHGDAFIAQAFGDRPERAMTSFDAGNSAATQGSCAITGSISQPRQTLRLTAASRLLQAPGDLVGEVYLGPRIGSDGETATVVHATDEDQTLWFAGQRVARAGTPSPAGSKIMSVSAPVLGPAGLVSYLLFTEAGAELCVSNGSQNRTLLRSGEQIGGRKVTSLMHGYHSDQADTEGRIVFYSEFESGAPAIVLAVPA